MRLDAWLQGNSHEALTETQARITDLVKHRVEALLRDSFRDLGRWRAELHTIANHLEVLEIDAKRAVAREAGVDPRELRVTPADDESVPSDGQS